MKNSKPFSFILTILEPVQFLVGSTVAQLTTASNNTNHTVTVRTHTTTVNHVNVGLIVTIGHVYNIPTMQLFDWKFQKYSVVIVYAIIARVSGIIKMMHCGILINMPYLSLLSSNSAYQNSILCYNWQCVSIIAK